MEQVADLVLWAYGRPELTLLNMKRLVQQSNLRNIYIVHDGLRQNASQDEVNSHAATREMILSQSLPTRVRPLLYDSNIGLTRHFLRVSKEVLKNCDGFLNHEDDKISNSETVRAILEVPKRESTPQLIDTRNQFLHSWKDSSVRSALYTVNGISYMNSCLIEAAEQDYNSQNFSAEDITSFLIDFYSPLVRNIQHVNRLATKFTEMLSWGISNQDRPDSLLLYSLLKRGMLKQITNSDMCLDLSHLDYRGLNQEYREPADKKVCSEIELVETRFGMICRFCEVEGIKTRIPVGNRTRASSYLKYQVDKMLGVGKGVKYFEKKQIATVNNFSQKDLEDYLFSNFSPGKK
jgi:hypothetical protein